MTQLEIAEIVEKKSRAIRNLNKYILDVEWRVGFGCEIPIGNSGAKIVVSKNDITYFKMKEAHSRLTAELMTFMESSKMQESERYTTHMEPWDTDTQMRQSFFDKVNRFNAEAKEHIAKDDYAAAKRCFNRAMSYQLGVREAAYVNSLDWGFEHNSIQKRPVDISKKDLSFVQTTNTINNEKEGEHQYV